MLFSKTTCRSCLVSSPDVQLVFELDPSLAKMLWECAEVEIKREDDLPAGLCSGCRFGLSQAHAFRSRCRESDELLRRLRPIKLEDDPLTDNKEPASSVHFEDSLVKVELLECKPEKSDPGKSKTKRGTKLPFKCHVCERPLCSAESLFRHMERKHSSDNKYDKYTTGWGKDLQYNCSECTYTARDRRYFDVHMRNHTGEKAFECTVCQKTFQTERSLKIHRNTHTDETLYTCNVCDKSYKNLYTYQNHVRRHKIDKKEYICETCNKSLSTKPSLVEHMKRHNNIKNHICENCQRSFISNYELRRHNLIMHSEEKNYECDTCGAKYTCKPYLERHMQSHMESNIHLCSLCGSRFSSKQALEKHMFRHKGERPYLCTLCDQAWFTKFELKRHEMSHSKERKKNYAKTNLIFQ